MDGALSHSLAGKGEDWHALHGVAFERRCSLHLRPFRGMSHANCAYLPEDALWSQVTTSGMHC